MKKLVVFALLLNALLLAGRFWQELPANAQAGPVVIENGNVNGDEKIDVSDVIYLAAFLFQGGPPSSARFR